jgi:Protein of unknown function (DUF4229)
VRPFLVYTAARMLVLFAVALLLWVIGLHGFLLAAFAVVLSLPLSYVLLARQRIAFGADVERRVAERQARAAGLRARLRGDDDADNNAAANAAGNDDDAAGTEAVANDAAAKRDTG